MAVSRGRFIQGVAIFIIVASTAIAAWLHFGPASGSGGGIPAITVGGPFELVNHNGGTVTDADFRGKFMLIFFGYTYCPDVCPTGLGIMAEALDILGPGAGKVVPIFISIDPKRDTPERLKEFVTNFHPRLVGLTGSPAQVSAVANAYRVFFAKVNPKEGEDPDNYAMAHANFTFLMGPDGENRTIFNGGTSPQEMAKRIKKFIY
ncbi:MAG TPA: SCO family protein [Rhodospirillales bacterium]|nr:SCO family protein [Rhodospirillales bacterium]